MSKFSHENSKASAVPTTLTEVQFDPTPALGREVLALFRGPFAPVRFPDVDLASLEADAEALLRCQAQAEAIERDLEQARHDTRDAAAVLSASAARALAYAKVFAMGQPHLEDALRSVRAGQDESAGERSQKKRRGRAVAHAGEQLPMVTSALDAAPTMEPDGFPEYEDGSDVLLDEQAAQ